MFVNCCLRYRTYLEEGENSSLGQPGGEGECESVETEGEGLTGLVLLTAANLHQSGQLQVTDSEGGS